MKLTCLFYLLCALGCSPLYSTEEIHLKPLKDVPSTLEGKLKIVQGNEVVDYTEPLDQYDYFIFCQEVYKSFDAFNIKLISLKERLEGAGIKALFIIDEGKPFIPQNSGQIGNLTFGNGWGDKSIIGFARANRFVHWPLLTEGVKKRTSFEICFGENIFIVLYDKAGKPIRGQSSSMDGHDINLNEFYSDIVP